MPILSTLTPNGTTLLYEIDAFRHFLATHPSGERQHFLPFFSAHPQLCAFLATLNDAVSYGTQVKTELSLCMRKMVWATRKDGRLDEPG